MSLSLTRGTIRRRAPRVKDRKTVLHAAGYVYRDLAKRAGVTYSMARKWIKDARTSARCERAFNHLIAHPKTNHG